MRILANIIVFGYTTVRFIVISTVILKMVAHSLRIYAFAANLIVTKYAGKNWSKGKVPNRVGIEERPAIVDSKERIGDWEVDTIVGKDQKSALVVATERKTKLTLIRKVENFKAEYTAQIVIAMLRKYKKWVHIPLRWIMVRSFTVIH